MSHLQSYLNSPKARRALSKRPGEEGFSLIELVVVVAVLAILSAIAIPSFTSINNKARASAAANTVATVAKECAVKYANGVTTPTRPSVTPDGYSAVTAGGSATGCTNTGLIVATSGTPANYASFTYNTNTGEKTCAPANSTGCSAAGTW
tara:strand:+ start:1963 stop:2412 length:450 start_codon:yes stop_codon:yes gene_type:complete